VFLHATVARIAVQSAKRAAVLDEREWRLVSPAIVGRPSGAWRHMIAIVMWGFSKKRRKTIPAVRSKRTTCNVRLQSAQRRVATGKGRRQTSDDEVRLSHAGFRGHRRTECGSVPSSRHRSGLREGGGARPRFRPPVAAHAVRQAWRQGGP